MSSELPARARDGARRALLVAGLCVATVGGCAQMAPGAQMAGTTTLCADQSAPRGWAVVAKSRNFDCGTNAYASWQWVDLRNSAPGRTAMVCRNPTIDRNLLPPGWVATGAGDTSIKCGPWGDNERIEVSYRP